ncbi:hypothetical protein SCLARK_00564 [Spiroplasma clarkii]|nr:hypothetical protein SCLARK_00564 [Spiroplasma clarkii]
MFEYESKILLNRYFAYDVFGNFQSSAESAADAIRKMQNQISLTSKFINKAEIESWNGRPRSYEEIIQDGVYTVYSIVIDKNSGKKIYFANYDNALKAVKAGLQHTTIKSDDKTTLFLYAYVDEFGESKIYIFKSDAEIYAIVREILS